MKTMDGEKPKRAYLPKHFQSRPDSLYDVYFVISDPDGRVNEDGILVDLNTAITLTSRELVGLVAHELHHNYRNLNTPDFEHPLMVELNKIHQEGLADLIDKDEPPLEKQFFYPKSFLDMYNQVYFNTPQILTALEKKTLEFEAGEISEEDYLSFLKYYFKFGGHPNGLYMSLIIKKELGHDVLIASYNDPVEFLKLYNTARSMTEGEPQFSDTFMSFVSTTIR